MVAGFFMSDVAPVTRHIASLPMYCLKCYARCVFSVESKGGESSNFGTCRFKQDSYEYDVYLVSRVAHHGAPIVRKMHLSMQAYAPVICT